MQVPKILSSQIQHGISQITFLIPSFLPNTSMVTPPNSSASPYVLHPSDFPSLILVFGLLTGDNFPKWQKSMTHVLNAKNKLSFVDDTLSPPNKNSAEYTQWNQTKNMFLTWLLNSISPSIANSLEFHTDPREVWLDLQSSFCHGNNARIYHLKRELSSLHQNTHSIHDTTTRLNNSWMNSVIYNKPMILKNYSNKQRMSEFTSFSLASTIHSPNSKPKSWPRGPFPHQKKISNLFQEEQQSLLQVRPISTEAHVFAAHSDGPQKSSFKCTECGRNGHTRDHC